MSERDDGGPAFPIPADEPGNTYTGMSLRDYFAGQALCGLLNKSQNTPCACTASSSASARASFRNGAR